MRISRKKHCRKVLTFYKCVFDLDGPYTVLVDGTFVHHAITKLDQSIIPRVEPVLGRDVRFAVPQSVLDELEGLLDTCAPAHGFCSYMCRKVGPRGLGAAEAMLEAVGPRNEHKYVVATHDPALRRRLQKIPGLPLLRFENSVLTLDSPTLASRRMAHALERAEGKLDEDEREAAQRPRAAQEARGVREADTTPTHATRRIQQCSRNFAPAPPPERGGKKRAAAPNPLSRKPPKRRRNPPPPSSPEAPWSIIPPGKTRPRRKKQVPPPRGYEWMHLRETGRRG
mmetsp:Transcript_14149/g.42172  ORF Transcript_14149/g.42172 Transcript_14149/m.42172 type:complete len:283 (-) Transcript_14149:210-1058(-)